SRSAAAAVAGVGRAVGVEPQHGEASGAGRSRDEELAGAVDRHGRRRYEQGVIVTGILAERDLAALAEGAVEAAVGVVARHGEARRVAAHGCLARPDDEELAVRLGEGQVVGDVRAGTDEVRGDLAAAAPVGVEIAAAVQPGYEKVSAGEDIAIGGSHDDLAG